MRRFLLAAFAALVAAKAAAQTFEWGQVPPNKAVIAVILPATDGNFKITDRASFDDVIAARTDQPVVKSYTVEPGTYSFITDGTADPVSVSVPAGSVHVVAYDPSKATVHAEDFGEALEGLKSHGAANWIWLGQQSLDTAHNQLFISPRPGTDDPGPMMPR